MNYASWLKATYFTLVLAIVVALAGTSIPAAAQRVSSMTSPMLPVMLDFPAEP